MDSIIKIPTEKDVRSLENQLIRFDNESLFAFVDLETFGLNLSFEYNRPWQASIITRRNGQNLRFEDLFIDWGKECKLSISEEAANVTGYNVRQVERYGWKTMSQVYEELKKPQKQQFAIIKEVLDECDYICGHNVLGFDLPLIYEWYRFNGECPKHLHDKVYDTLSLFRGLKSNTPPARNECIMSYQYKMLNKRIKGCSLSAAGKHFSIDHNYANLHDAQVDLELNIKVWDKIKWNLEV